MSLSLGKFQSLIHFAVECSLRVKLRSPLPSKSDSFLSVTPRISVKVGLVHYSASHQSSAVAARLADRALDTTELSTRAAVRMYAHRCPPALAGSAFIASCMPASTIEARAVYLSPSSPLPSFQDRQPAVYGKPILAHDDQQDPVLSMGWHTDGQQRRSLSWCVGKIEV